VLTRYTLLVPHSNEDRLLVATTGDRTSLPAVTRDDDSFWQNVDHVNGMVDVLLGLPATTRRCLVGARDRLVDAYLKPWEALVPRKCLRRAWELCAELSGLYGALVYHREVLPQIEVGWEMERMLPFFARQLLEPGERSV
jgi:hypothetical protein